jgi:hypothetical protein
MSGLERLSHKQEALIAALLSERTHEEAAAKAGISSATLRRWLHLPAFRAAYRQARRELVEAAVGRLQAATGQAVDTLLAVARDAEAKDSDRVRAAVALLDHAFRGLAEADALHDERGAGDASPMGTGDVVQLLAARLRQLSGAELPTGEKARLTATLADALLRAFAVDERMLPLDEVLELWRAALEAIRANVSDPVLLRAITADVLRFMPPPSAMLVESRAVAVSDPVPAPAAGPAPDGLATPSPSEEQRGK